MSGPFKNLIAGEWAGGANASRNVNPSNTHDVVGEYRFIPDLEMVERHTQEHLQILELLEQDDREQAASLMRNHLHWSGGGDQIG